MNQLVGHATLVGWIVVKTVLLYLTAVFGLRLGERRMLAEMSAFDFVAAVALGAIIGRIPNSSDVSYLEGAATLVTIIVAHRVLSRLRFRPAFGRLVDHPPQLLVADGRVLPAQLRRAGLTDDDLSGLLRRQGVRDLREVQYVVFEQRGRVSVVRSGDPKGDLVTAVLQLQDGESTGPEPAG